MNLNNEMIKNYISYFENLNTHFYNHENNNNVAVIIEPRKHEYLLGVIKNVMTKLDKTWNLHIFGSDLNEQYLKENLQGNFIFTNLKINNLDQKTYSLLLLSQTFWSSIKEENILIFQTDSFIVNEKYEIPKEYAFLGASYNYGKLVNLGYIDVVAPPNYNYSINGGFSFRKKKAMIECIQKVSNQDIFEFRKKYQLNTKIFKNNFILQEDVFFNHALLLLNYELPSIETCNSFCSQQYKNYDSFGIHAFNQSCWNFNEKDLLEFFKIKHEKTLQFQKEKNKNIEKKTNKNLIIL